VIVRALDAALGATPAALLAGDNTLERNFTLVDGGSADGLAWVDATPKSAESTFTKVRIGFRDQAPRAMELVDAFGQTTRLTFDRFERNVALAADLFRFTPPPGADVVSAPSAPK
jgi:outer membrane lipoprotein carrier protein